MIAEVIGTSGNDLAGQRLTIAGVKHMFVRADNEAGTIYLRRGRDGGVAFLKCFTCIIAATHDANITGGTSMHVASRLQEYLKSVRF